MLFKASTFAVLAALLPSMVSAHMELIGPASVFKAEGFPNDPLDDAGSKYPCYTTSNPGAPPVAMGQGTTQNIKLRGSAIHGGGSCQISVTYDNPPTKNSIFRVIKSFQGNCPAGNPNGNLVASNDQTFDFVLPSDVPTGNAVLAWTWFNKIGNREMYMRCAPIQITGSNSGNQAAFNALPEIFKANIGNGCSTTEGTDVIFPNPGKNVVGTGTAPPVGNCGSKVQLPEISAPILIEKPSSTSTAAITQTTTVNNQQPATTTTASSTITAAPSSTPSSSPKGDSPKGDSPKGDKPKGDKPKDTPTGAACTDGEIVCLSKTTFAICNWGEIVPMGATAAGTECSGGKIVLAKRNVRFSHDHMRRRHNSAL